MPPKNIVRHQKVSKAKLARAKELRSKMTPAEAVLWRELRRIPFPPHFGVRASDPRGSIAHPNPIGDWDALDAEALRAYYPQGAACP